MLQNINCLKGIASPGVKWYSSGYLGTGAQTLFLVDSVTKMGLHALSEMTESHLLENGSLQLLPLDQKVSDESFSQ